MRWRVLLQGHQFDLDALTRLFPDGALAVKADTDYHYLTSEDINASPTSAEAQQRAALQLPLLNGVGRAAEAGFRPVELAGVVIDEAAPHSRHVFLEAKLEGRSRLTVGGPPPTAPPPLVEKARADPALMEALTRFGSSPDADWFDLYKIYEVLRDAAGGQDAFLRRLELSKSDLGRFTRSANHPDASGQLARHARSRDQPPPDPMSLPEGQQFIARLVQLWSAKNPDPGPATSQASAE